MEKAKKDIDLIKKTLDKPIDAIQDKIKKQLQDKERELDKLLKDLNDPDRPIGDTINDKFDEYKKIKKGVDYGVNPLGTNPKSGEPSIVGTITYGF